MQTINFYAFASALVRVEAHTLFQNICSYICLQFST